MGTAKSAANSRPAQDSRRVNVNFSGDAYDALEELARESGDTLSNVIRESIALKRWVRNTQKEGGRILVERNGQLRELIPF
ncbi:MAG: hypothetical protein ACRDJH_15220 [Thermomicrobiales bacterium]